MNPMTYPAHVVTGRHGVDYQPTPVARQASSCPPARPSPPASDTAAPNQQADQAAASVWRDDILRALPAIVFMAVGYLAIWLA